VSIQFSRLALDRDLRLWHNASARAALIAAAFFLIAGTAATSVARAQTGYLTYPLGGAGVTAADLNGDGKPDLVVAAGGSLSILLNNGAGGFTALPPLDLSQFSIEAYATLAVDLNGDHKTDLVVLSGTQSAPGLWILLGNGDGTFQTPVPVSGCPEAFGAQVADMNGDGIPDLVTMCPVPAFEGPEEALLMILPGKGDGTFGAGIGVSNPPYYYYTSGVTLAAGGALAIGDFNGDGKPDIAVATAGTLTVFLNGGKDSFTPVSLNDEPWVTGLGIAAADFNGDGLLDLAVSGSPGPVGTPSGTITILLGRGDGTFRAAPSLQVAGSPGQLIAMDLNGDGHVDLALGRPFTFFPGRGDGTFGNGLSLGDSGNTGYVAFADFTVTGLVGFAVTNVPHTFLVSPGNVMILPQATWPSPTLANTPAAGFSLGPLAAGSIATAFGVNLAAETAQPAGTPQTSLGGATVTVTDSSGAVLLAPLFYVSPAQINYLIPAGTASGLATVTVTASGNVTATGQIEIVPVAPALFAVNPAGLAAANAVLVSLSGEQTFETIYQTDQNGNVTGVPIDFGSDTDTVYVVLYGTGIRNRSSLSAVTATLGGTANNPFSSGAPVTYAGPQGFENPDGLDQVNLQLPRALVSGPQSFSPVTTTLQLTVDGQPSDQVTLLIQ
jgi:uncharacterized protein (TIGR03437 family)